MAALTLTQESIAEWTKQIAERLNGTKFKAKQSVCDVTAEVVVAERGRIEMRDWLKDRKETWATQLYTTFKNQKQFVLHLELAHGCTMKHSAYE